MKIPADHSESTAESGFTLIEIAVTVALIMMALIPMGDLFSTGFGNSRRSLELSRAVDISQETLEGLLIQSPDSLAAGSSVLAAEPPFPAYRIDYQSEEVDEELGLWKIGVEISWGSAGNEKECTTAVYAAVQNN